MMALKRSCVMEMKILIELKVRKKSFYSLIFKKIAV